MNRGGHVVDSRDTRRHRGVWCDSQRSPREHGMSKSAKPKWIETLEWMQEQNEPLQVMDLSDSADETIVPLYRANLLAIEDGALVLERPRQAVMDQRLLGGSVVSVAATDKHSRWEFTSTVLETVSYELNGRTALPAVKLSMPSEVRSAQRRDFFRVSVVGANLKPVRMQALVDDSELPGSDVFEATVLNVGGGGLGVQLEHKPGFDLSQFAYYRCVFELPTYSTPLELKAQLVHLETGPTGKSYLGLSFEFASKGVQETVADVICRFCAWHQRQQIQRERQRA